jgi:hypothetical protein
MYPRGRLPRKIGQGAIIVEKKRRRYGGENGFFREKGVGARNV